MIGTGAARGKICAVGRRIQELLAAAGIPARVQSTDGSRENLELLRRRSGLAGLQYDVALAALFGQTRAVYGVDPEVAIEPLPGLRGIASLHEAKAHAIIRRDLLAEQPPEWMRDPRPSGGGRAADPHDLHP